MDVWGRAVPGRVVLSVEKQGDQWGGMRGREGRSEVGGGGEEDPLKAIGSLLSVKPSSGFQLLAYKAALPLRHQCLPLCLSLLC